MQDRPTKFRATVTGGRVDFVRTATEQPGEATARIRTSADTLRTVVLVLDLALAEDA
ncbi:MAG: hypothetical protein QOG96_5562, partial [Pseudonocardiales bacterium]|nr:hypothetical protein [Pseudonocardiales bacterium]